jgi:muramidase (phage lysozyme)
LNNNLKAWLDMLSRAEGTDYGSENGYNILVGSTRLHPDYFKGYADHPRIVVPLPKLGIKSTAAGKYQIKANIFDAYRKPLHLDDKVLYPLGAFSPAAQDAIALQLIKECHALPLITSGNFIAAVQACSSRWASLPGAGYKQREQKLSFLVAAYTQAGGSTA